MPALRWFDRLIDAREDERPSYRIKDRTRSNIEPAIRTRS